MTFSKEKLIEEINIYFNCKDCSEGRATCQMCYVKAKYIPTDHSKKKKKNKNKVPEKPSNDPFSFL